MLHLSIRNVTIPITRFNYLAFTEKKTMMNNQELIKYFTLKLDLLDKKEKLGFVFPANYRIELTNKLNALQKQIGEK